MCSVHSAVSGEILAVVDDYEGKTAKEVKRFLVPQIGVSRFRQKFWSEDWSHEIQDDFVFAEQIKIQLVLSEFWPPDLKEDRRMLAASRNNDLGVLEKLLQQPRDPNFSDAQGQTALHHARGHVDVFRLLIEAKADSNKTRTRDGITPLHFAAKTGYVEVGRVLLEAGADMNAATTDAFGATPLFLAAQNGHVEVVCLFD